MVGSGGGGADACVAAYIGALPGYIDALAASPALELLDAQATGPASTARRAQAGSVLRMVPRSVEPVTGAERAAPADLTPWRGARAVARGAPSPRAAQLGETPGSLVSEAS
ncbi:hypothetical protein SCE1572_07735 [Sorangium cellulosum So0157-2]|uniref:Uncharacterized protein n=1 Tax=Sorangium cellulosum So0157-2 TaxID=1254432 RepID=S4XPQ1_SORCE|nr:hypothetical protein SCE1572_07735 [Sorangium cellulosum So0157-2]